MVRLRIDDLLAQMPVAPARHLDAERVERYLLEPSEEPLVVFDCPEGLLLADGRHRLAAARRRGDETIEAELREGTRADALAYAVANAMEQRGISAEEALERIERREH